MPKIPTRDEMRAKVRAMQRKIGSKPVVGPVFNLALGLGVTLKTMSKRSVTQQYPKEKPDLPPRSRGVIALKEENCTVCMLCSRECPDWCIYIDSHKEVMPPKEPGARSRTRNVLDRFAIDYALCMYCGICVEVCPFDALFWAPHFEYSTFDITELTHEMPQLGEWMNYVEPPPPFEVGAEPAKEEAAEPKAIGARVAAPPPSTAPAVEAAGPTAPAQAPAEPPGAPEAAPEAHEREEPEIDEEVFQREMAAGKPERVARALAKRAWVVKRRQQRGGG